MTPNQKRLRDCISQSLRERNISLSHYRTARPLDKLFDAIRQTDCEDARELAAVTLVILCDSTSPNIDAVGILAATRFLDEVMKSKNATNGNPDLQSLCDMIANSGRRHDYLGWIDAWYE